MEVVIARSGGANGKVSATAGNLRPAAGGIHVNVAVHLALVHLVGFAGGYRQLIPPLTLRRSDGIARRNGGGGGADAVVRHFAHAQAAVCAVAVGAEVVALRSGSGKGKRSVANGNLRPAAGHVHRQLAQVAAARLVGFSGGGLKPVPPVPLARYIDGIARRDGRRVGAHAVVGYLAHQPAVAVAVAVGAEVVALRGGGGKGKRSAAGGDLAAAAGGVHGNVTVQPASVHLVDFARCHRQPVPPFALVRAEGIAAAQSKRNVFGVGARAVVEHLAHHPATGGVVAVGAEVVILRNRRGKGKCSVAESDGSAAAGWVHRKIDAHTASAHRVGFAGGGRQLIPPLAL